MFINARYAASGILQANPDNVPAQVYNFTSVYPGGVFAALTHGPLFVYLTTLIALFLNRQGWLFSGFPFAPLRLSMMAG